ncbi:hypothetical protein HELRODRAFT_163104 [Helobdella robusta]|uniref:Reelin domain-containing protein n=1 Tax=Helobdella robusta TaxID=6412 RepID=T1ETN5_HELRO|nr:hypothetical protein HELRODRAFT_163104 [Helobdella robusta]ESN96074.1 hypothetical protein HELRODRAFT_163104 [Helobdella robusta]
MLGSSFRILLVFATSLACCVYGFSTGCPMSACSDLLPNHGYRQTGPCPIKVTTDVQCYQAGKPVTITIKGGDGKKYRGIGLQVRQKAGDGIAEGVFEKIDTTQYKLNSCYGEKNYFTFRDNEEKDGTTLTWIPESQQGELEIV